MELGTSRTRSCVCCVLVPPSDVHPRRSMSGSSRRDDILLGSSEKCSLSPTSFENNTHLISPLHLSS